jgi:hypothetical protein
MKTSAMIEAVQSVMRKAKNTDDNVYTQASSLGLLPRPNTTCGRSRGEARMD